MLVTRVGWPRYAGVLQSPLTDANRRTLLTMQKVVGSSPIIRSLGKPRKTGLLCCRQSERIGLIVSLQSALAGHAASLGCPTTLVAGLEPEARVGAEEAARRSCFTGEPELGDPLER